MGMPCSFELFLIYKLRKTRGCRALKNTCSNGSLEDSTTNTAWVIVSHMEQSRNSGLACLGHDTLIQGFTVIIGWGEAVCLWHKVPFFFLLLLLRLLLLQTLLVDWIMFRPASLVLHEKFLTLKQWRLCPFLLGRWEKRGGGVLEFSSCAP